MRAFVLIALPWLMTSAALAGPAPDVAERPLELRLSWADEKHTQVEARIINRGRKAVLLIKPGDGSWCGYRSPIVGFSTVPLKDGAALHPAKPPPQGNLGCPLIDPVTREQIVTLRPGESIEIAAGSLDEVGPFDRSGCSVPRPKGEWSVRFFYRNDPVHPWRARDRNDPALMSAMRRSNACDLISNELTFTDSGIGWIDPRLPRHLKEARILEVTAVAVASIAFTASLPTLALWNKRSGSCDAGCRR